MRAWADVSDIFRPARARPVSSWERWVLGALVFLGVQSIAFFGLWWFQARNVSNLLLFVLLSLATWWGILRMCVGWYNAFHLEQPDAVPAPPGLSVAVFTTSHPGEPYDMFVRTLSALRKVRYPHTAYLLDDTRDPRMRALAEETGAVHLELLGLPGAKAGKINAALQKTTEEFIVILDPDHIPFPEFLDRVLGYFRDPAVGNVQVAQAYHNAGESFVARGAAEQTFAFYGPILQGMHGTGTAVAIGANGTFRRAALDSIGGHGLGLAEDLVTSIRLHAKGWKSVYVPEIVSRGLVPADLDSYLKQQLKWSRGVFEVLLREYPRAYSRLTGHQRISYLMIGTYYLVGVTTLIYVLIPLISLAAGQHPAVFFMSEYLRHVLPVGLCGVAIYRFTQRWLIDPVRERGFHLRGTLLKIGAWSVYLKGFVLSVLGVAVPYIPTPKNRRTGSFRTLAGVPLVLVAASIAALLWTAYRRLLVVPESEVRITTELTLGMAAFALLNVVLMSGRIYAAWKGREVKAR